MVVKVEGSVNADGLTGTAFSVSYDDDVEGGVENLTATDELNIKTFEDGHRPPDQVVPSML